MQNRTERNRKKNPNKCQKKPRKSACGIKPVQKGEKSEICFSIKTKSTHLNVKISPKRHKKDGYAQMLEIPELESGE